MSKCLQVRYIGPGNSIFLVMLKRIHILVVMPLSVKTILVNNDDYDDDDIIDDDYDENFVRQSRERVLANSA